ncbi:MAG: HAMP domain-containing sensor histidine kinase [Erysipelotrichaceae bacterium]|nr:HAMP domain-containing sensor histidine kinase [Erysipelotrichaceae bacterium]
MIKKLRLKFILINMSIVTLMLGLIFSMLYFSTANNLEKESIEMLNEIAENPRALMSPNKRDDIYLPYFCVVTNRTGNIVEMAGGFYDLSDLNMLQGILEETVNTNTYSGVLNDYNLRFIRSVNPLGQYFVYLDISGQKAILNGLLKTLLLTGSVAFLIFLGISYLLAKWAVKPVEKAFNQQKQFVADASHELKTPLTVILTDTELLKDSDESEKEELTNSISSMAKQMRGLVEELLDLARIDNGTAADNFTRINMSSIVEESAMTFEPLFFEKEKNFTYEIDKDIYINGNELHIKQLSDILLDNAVKYANGECSLSLKKNNKKCLLTVSSQGEKISDEDLKNIFKRFYKVDKARTSNNSYGLGLSIAENIVKEHKGKIYATSENGVNSFFVELNTYNKGRC